MNEQTFFFQISSTFSFFFKSFCPGNLSLAIFLSFLLPHSFSHFLLIGIKWPKIKLHSECSGKLWKSFYPSKFHSKFSFLSHFPTCSLPNMLTKTTYFVSAEFFHHFSNIWFCYALPLHMLFPFLSSLFPSPYGQRYLLLKSQLKCYLLCWDIIELYRETGPEHSSFLCHCIQHITSLH